ncbi:unnamed protein product [Aphanomyces euteiches]
MWSRHLVLRTRQATTQARHASQLAHVLVKGQGDGPKKTVVIMHGILGNKGNWGTFSRRIVNTFPDWQVLGLDHRVLRCNRRIIYKRVRKIDLLASLNITPDVACGHSFGGKVALTYLDACRRENLLVPKDTWVLDALPGCEQTDYATRAQDKTFNSTDFVLPALMEVPLPITSKKGLVQLLEAKGFETGQAQWMTTNLKAISNSPEEYVWKMDLPVIHTLFRAFLTTDCWPILTYLPGDANVHFVRAEYNKFWTNEVVRRFDGVDRVHLHLLEMADHWVHVDNPTGLFALMEQSFKE